MAARWLFEFWAHEHQKPPRQEFSNWILLGGRGAGKTRAGAEWVRQCVEGSTRLEKGRFQRVALIADTYQEVRDVMVFGDSGIMSISPPDRKPVWIESRRALIWPNGAMAQAYSAQKPEQLRGPQFHGAWLDEFAKWKNAQRTWDMLQFALRLGDHPQTLITTTPKPHRLLEALIERPETQMTHASTFENRENLSTRFLDNIQQNYAGTLLGRQEIDGEFVRDLPNALWTSEQIAIDANMDFRRDRIVIAVDPNVSSKEHSDACGIVVAAAEYREQHPQSWRALVLQDATMKRAKPEDWASKVVSLYHEYDACQIVAEVNQGGELVETMLRQFDPLINFIPVHAKQAKWARAEPVAVLYRQGRVYHAAKMPELEDEMLHMTTTGYKGAGSPDHLDALVWAIDALMLNGSSYHRSPSYRNL